MNSTESIIANYIYNNYENVSKIGLKLSRLTLAYEISLYMKNGETKEIQIPYKEIRKIENSYLCYENTARAIENYIKTLIEKEKYFKNHLTTKPKRCKL